MYQSTEENKGTSLDSTQPLMELRMFIYDTLRRAFLSEPDASFLENIQKVCVSEGFPFQKESKELAEGVAEIGQFLKQLDVANGDSMDRLYWDYTRLFIGPHELPTPPWESAYLSEERLLFQKETLEVRRAYLKYALIAKEFKREADDHLGLELDFMYQLCLLALKGIDEQKSTEVREIIEDQRDFLEKHLLQWVPQLCQDILQNANTSFYRGMAKVLSGALTVDYQATQDLLEVLNTDRAQAI